MSFAAYSFSTLLGLVAGAGLSWQYAKVRWGRRGDVNGSSTAVDSQTESAATKNVSSTVAISAKAGGDSRDDQIVRKISQAFNEGSEMMEDLAAKVQRIEALVNATYESLNQIFEAGQQAAASSMASRQSMENLRTSLSQLNELSGSLTTIGEHLGKVDEKSQVIHRIARQANLLSFNAAIEAARAGEHGRGFGVVAKDVNRLSDLSADAASEMTAILKISMDQISTLTKTVNSEFELFSEASGNVLETFSDIDGQMQTINTTSTRMNQDSELTRDEIREIGEQAKTSMEALTKLLADVTGEITGKTVHDIAPREARLSLTSYRIIDVRRPDEFNDELGHLEKAELICLQDNFKGRIAGFDKEAAYLFVCRSGGRSARGARIAQALGFKNVSNLEGGMLEWRKHFPR